MLIEDMSPHAYRMFSSHAGRIAESIMLTNIHTHSSGHTFGSFSHFVQVEGTLTFGSFSHFLEVEGALIHSHTAFTFCAKLHIQHSVRRRGAEWIRDCVYESLACGY